LGQHNFLSLLFPEPRNVLYNFLSNSVTDSHVRARAHTHTHTHTNTHTQNTHTHTHTHTHTQTHTHKHNIVFSKYKF